jgi:hypothetical protein
VDRKSIISIPVRVFPLANINPLFSIRLQRLPPLLCGPPCCALLSLRADSCSCLQLAHGQLRNGCRKLEQATSLPARYDDNLSSLMGSGIRANTNGILYRDSLLMPNLPSPVHLLPPPLLPNHLFLRRPSPSHHQVRLPLSIEVIIGSKG